MADTQILPFTAVGNTWEDLTAKAEAFARDQARPRGPTHLGLGVASGPDGLGLALIFSRRPVALAPLPAQLPARGLAVRGRARQPETLTALWLGPCAGGADDGCAGAPTALAVHRPGPREVRIDLPATRRAGRYLFQMLSPGPRGPEVVAAWTFTRGKAAGAWPPPAPRAPSEDAAGARALVDAARGEADLPPLGVDPALDAAAQAHAEAMCRAKVTGHQLPGGAPPDVRARAAGYRGVVRENVARAQSVGQAHLNLLLSPSHRAALMDPAAEDLGIGVATAPGGEGLTESRCVVQLFGRGAGQR
ncbi:MAG: CAP domain-containing protein [Deltaproteobacteria bacterium]|nr:CAP domain-containing protein [Deltaproteobacteria bacterium]